VVTAEVQWEVSSRQFFAAFPVFAAWHHLRLTSYPISKTLNKNRNLTFHGLA
jgi:hypothetical protein